MVFNTTRGRFDKEQGDGRRGERVVGDVEMEVNGTLGGRPREQVVGEGKHGECGGEVAQQEVQAGRYDLKVGKGGFALCLKEE